MADPKQNQHMEPDTKGRGDQNEGGQNWPQNPGQESGGKDGRPAAQGTATRTAGDQKQGNCDQECENPKGGNG